MYNQAEKRSLRPSEVIPITKNNAMLQLDFNTSIVTKTQSLFLTILGRAPIYFSYL